MIIAALATVYALMGSAIVAAPPAQADTKPGFGIGTTGLYRPTGSTGRYIYVDAARGADFAYDPTGHEAGDAPWPRNDCLHGNRTPYWARTNGLGSANCPQPDAAHPMRTIKVAIYASRPGDVIVVRGGTYNEAISTTGDGRTDHKGTSSTHRLVLQNYPGESVRLNGYINFQDPDYWTIAGIRFGWHSTITANRHYIVGMFGGTGWLFQRNEVSGAHGNANMLVSFASGGPSAATAPQSWRVNQNCIHNNRGTNPGNTDHNLYVKGDKVFQSNYVSGLRVLDISDPTEPEEVGFFDTVPFGDDSPRFDGSWSNYPFFKSGVIAVTSGYEGLFIVRYREADRPIS